MTINVIIFSNWKRLLRCHRSPGYFSPWKKPNYSANCEVNEYFRAVKSERRTPCVYYRFSVQGTRFTRKQPPSNSWAVTRDARGSLWRNGEKWRWFLIAHRICLSLSGYYRKLNLRLPAHLDENSWRNDYSRLRIRFLMGCHSGVRRGDSSSSSLPLIHTFVSQTIVLGLRLVNNMRWDAKVNTYKNCTRL